MRVLSMTWVAVVLVGLLACGGEDEGDPTTVAVTNDGSASIDATLSDGETELSFHGVAAGTTSTFQTASFSSLSSLTMTVAGESSSVDLTEGLQNVVVIDADGKVKAVTAQAPASSGGGDGW
jgi:hypothetical protein